MSRTPWTTRITAGALLACALFANAAGAQAPAAQQPPPSMVAAVLSAERSGEPFTLTYFNRPIVVLRASVLGRPPAQRAAIAVQVLDDLVAACHPRKMTVIGDFNVRGGIHTTVTASHPSEAAFSKDAHNP